MAKIIDGKQIAKELKLEIIKKIEQIDKSEGRKPGIAIVKANADSASESYTKSIVKVSDKLGIVAIRCDLGENATENTIIECIEALNNRTDIDGIIVQRPLPDNCSIYKVNSVIDPKKDIDGVNPINLGFLMMGHKSFLPSTPRAVDYIMEYENIDLTGKNVSVIGRSEIVGKPVGMLMLNRNATVRYCHSKTIDLKSVLLDSDVIIAATGVANLVTGDMVKKDAVVIDVGINFVDGKMVGDVEFESAEKNAGYITPVPGGVGSITTTMLMVNLMEAYDGHEN